MLLHNIYDWYPYLRSQYTHFVTGAGYAAVIAQGYFPPLEQLVQNVVHDDTLLSLGAVAFYAACCLLAHTVGS